MQPLYSVDHESRQNSCRAAEEPSAAAAEETPLLYRFPSGGAARSPGMLAAVGALLALLLAGVVIGTYLLVLQSDSENVLPPVESPLQP